MASDRQIIRELLDRYYDETFDSISDQYPSKLVRGEGTEKNYFILKIDLVGSTQLLLNKKKPTYLKLAHTFLSTIDEITQRLGAESEQVEYAGDSVMAYFPETSANATDVLAAACCCRVAVSEMQKLNQTFKEMNFKCKTVLHYAPLIVARIGPRSHSSLLAIGYPLHVVAKLEKETAPDTARVTMAFYKKVEQAHRKYLYPLYSSNASAPSEGIIASARSAAPTVAPAASPAPSLAEMLQALAAEYSSPAPASDIQAALAALGAVSRGVPPVTQQTIPSAPPEQIGATLKWNLLYAALGLDNNDSKNIFDA